MTIDDKILDEMEKNIRENEIIRCKDMLDVIAELRRTRVIDGKFHADLYGMQDGALLRDLQTENNRLTIALQDFAIAAHRFNVKVGLGHISVERDALNYFISKYSKKENTQ